MLWWWRVNRWFVDYFPVKLIKTHDLNPDKSYLVGYHPHGVLSFGAFSCFSCGHLNPGGLFPGLRPRVLTLKLCFAMPGFREHLLASGVACASKKGIQSVLKQKGTMAILVPGGAKEALYVGDGEKVKLFLNNRKGFIKIALEQGCDLVPTFGFGENNIFRQVPNPEGSLIRIFQEWMRKHITFTVPFFFGRGVLQYTYGILPFRNPINVVIGSPIHVEKVENPSKEVIQEYHAKYVSALKRLYDTYNPKYGNPNVKLVIT